MSYESDDQSIHDGQPVELFRFIGPNTAQEYYLTSFQEDVSFMGETYVATTVERSNFPQQALGDTWELTVSMPVTEQLVKDYLFDIPPRNLELTVFRMHTPAGPSIELWRGRVTDANAAGSLATFRSVYIHDQSFQSEVPAVRYQGVCNHRLYDAVCGVDPNAPQFNHPTTIVSVTDTTIVVASNGGNSAGEYIAGDILRSADGERRTIVDHTGTTIEVDSPFRTLGFGDAVVLFFGCDHTATTCRDKFTNIQRHGSHPYISPTNVFVIGFRGF